MNILFLTVTDQQKHPMGRYIDLHRTYDFNNWVEGFSSIPHVFFSFDYYKSFVDDGPSATEHLILGIVRNRSIDLVIIPNLYYEINASFLTTLRATGTKSLVVFFDDSLRFEATNQYYLGQCDYIVTHESDRALDYYRPYGVTVDFFPCLPSVTFYDRLLSESMKANPDLCDVSFVGANIADRATFLGALTAAGLAVSVYGSGWPNGRVSQSAMLGIFRDSKISLNFTKSFALSGGKQLKARAFEIMLAGGFLLTEYDEGLVTYFDVGREIDTFSSPEECVEKTKYYLDNPSVRETIRQRGIEKCRKQLNFETAWTRYLARLESPNGPEAESTTLVDCPILAVRSFVRWNLGFLEARFRNIEPGLAVDQFLWLLRDLRYLSAVYSNRVWLTFLSEAASFSFRGVKPLFEKSHLLRRIKRSLIRVLGVGKHVHHDR